MLITWLAAAALAGPLTVDSRTLENGLDVHVIPLKGANSVALFTWFDVGSGSENEPGRTGYAHFFEHLMFHGTPTQPRAEREHALLRLGVDDNAWTWFDETVYHLVMPPESLPEVLAMEADRFQHLALTPEGVRREAGAVYGELRKSLADPEYHIDQALLQAAYGEHPYSHDTLGFEADIAAMPDGYDHAVAFYRRWYRPEHASVIVVGGIEPEAAHKLVADTLGAWPRGEYTQAQLPMPALKGPISTTASVPMAVSPRWALAWRVPGHRADNKDLAALEVASQLLFDDTGTLPERLQRQSSLVYDVSGSRETFAEAALFRVVLTLADLSKQEQVEQIVREEVAKLAAGPDAERVAAAREHVVNATRLRLADPVHTAETFGWELRRTGQPGALAQWLETVSAVTADDVARACQTYLVPANEVELLLSGAPQETP